MLLESESVPLPGALETQTKEVTKFKREGHPCRHHAWGQESGPAVKVVVRAPVPLTEMPGLDTSSSS